ncbi:hypothetical protein HYDPIDRAFT_97381, partial [Hydnomerulius pinastri MD-312]
STPNSATAQSANSSMEFAGNASLRSLTPSDPLCSSQIDADIDWNADTGATSHMTPHRHWIRNHAPKHVPICLADHTVVYSAGIGSVVFNPAVGGGLICQNGVP